jgi:mono/diheme cytochrome c family protein
MRTILGLLLGAAAIFSTGCGSSTTRQPPIFVFPDMRFQGRYDPQMERPFFSDRRSSRVPVAGTVARGMLKEDDVFYTGLINGEYLGRNPLKIDAELLAHGQKRFNTYCSPCHDKTGQGRGLVGQRAMWIPTNLTEDRVKQFNDGEIFNVLTHGRRSMPSYQIQVSAADRWAIVAYVRALQRTTMGTPDEVPADQRSSLK